jgi:CxxC-x17-CxxC domain-containing protein
MHGGGGGDFRGSRPSFEITCSNCGKKDTVPFKPRDENDVLCRECFQAQRQAA